MKSILSNITISPELRPCKVKIKSDEYENGLFHQWINRSEVAPPSPMNGVHSGGVICGTFGLVELKSGKIIEVYPYKIQFLDRQVEEYCFESL